MQMDLPVVHEHAPCPPKPLVKKLESDVAFACFPLPARLVLTLNPDLEEEDGEDWEEMPSL